MLDPRLSAEGEAARLAPPLASLDGALVGLLDNAKIGTARFYDYLEAMLRARYRRARGHPPPQAGLEPPGAAPSCSAS